MPNWKKVIVSGSNAVLNNITASGAISASGELYAGLSPWAGSDNSVVVLNNTTGELMYTGSYSSGGGIITVTEQDGTPEITTDTYNIFKFESGQITLSGGNTIEINAPTLDQVTDQGNTTSNSALFLTSPDLVWGNQGTATKAADSGFLNNGGRAQTHVTPQYTEYSFYMNGVMTTDSYNHELAGYTNNYLVYNKGVLYIGANGDLPSGGGGGGGTNPGDGTNDEDNPSDEGGHLVITGRSISLIASSSNESYETNNYRGVGLYPSALYFYNKEASGSVSGALQPTSASAKIKFDTGSNSIKFFAGSTNEELKEVLHISKSGDNPRIGIGVNNPLRAFDFKEVSDTNRGGEILIRGSRTTKGAEPNDEVGRINFIIDSSSYFNVETSGSAAEIIAIADEVDASGIKGSLSFRVSAQKTEDSVERLRITPDGTKVTGSLTVSGSNSFINIGPAEFTGSVSITDTLEVDGAVTHNSTTTHFGNVVISNGSLDVNDDGVKIRGTAGLTIGDIIIPNEGELRVVNHSMLLGGVHVGGTSDPGTDNLLVDGTTTLVGTTIISGSTLNMPNLTAGSVGSDYDKLLIVDSTGQVRTLADSLVPFIKVFDGEVPTNQTLVMFSGSTGNIANATGVSYNSGFGWTFSGAGSLYDITVDDLLVSNTITAVTGSFTGDISATNGSFSGDLTVDGNITANQYIVSSSVTYLTQSFSSGSTIFGDTLDDTHQFTGSVDITGSLISEQGTDKFVIENGTFKYYDSTGDHYLYLDQSGTHNVTFNSNTLGEIINLSLSSNSLNLKQPTGIGTPSSISSFERLVIKSSGTLPERHSFRITDSSNNTFFKVSDNSKIIIGSNGIPTASLDIFGDLRVSTNITASGNISASGALISSELTASGLNYPTTDGEDGQVLMTDGSGVLTFNDVKVYAQVKNISGTTLAKGTPVHATASASPPAGNVSEVIAASASLASTMPATFILNEELADGAEGRAILSGFINGVDTSAFSEGDVVYVGPDGGYTTTKPTGTNLIQNLGIITKVDASNGAGYIYGSGRSNDVPNLPVGKIWVGSNTYSVTSSVIHLDESNNRLGINTDNPTYQLHVSSSTAALGVYERAGGAALYLEGQETRGVLGTVGSHPLLIAYNSGEVARFTGTSFLVTGSLDVSTSITASGNISASGEIKTNTISTITTAIASDSATNVDTFNTSSYTGAIYDYTLVDTTVGARTGQFMIAQDSGSITFTDNSTKHLFDATAPEISAQINGANVEVQVTNGNGYTFKSFVKKL